MTSWHATVGVHTDSTQVRLLGRVPALDGVRGIAVLAVLGFHLQPFGLFAGGWLGVDVFFALSGFLITSLILEELALTGTFSFRRFHVRRMLRLQPALVLFIVVWTGLLLVAHDQPWFSSVPSLPVNPHATVPLSVGFTGILATLGQVFNWLAAFGVPGGPLGQVWSLSIEWQFYLVWPIALVVCYRRGRHATLAMTFTLVAASALVTAMVYHGPTDNNRVYFGTDTQAQALLLGAAAAQLLASGCLDRILAWRGWKVVAWSAAAALAAMALVLHHAQAWRAHGGWLLIAALTATVVTTLAGAPRGLGSHLLEWAPLRYVGRRSYALYLWSYVFCTWTRLLGPWPQTLCTLAGIFMTAEVSWRLIERPALALKGRYRASEPAQPPDRLAPRSRSVRDVLR
jgi:peptidoglycan/LPS O-acetylase OafA/YrhL